MRIISTGKFMLPSKLVLDQTTGQYSPARFVYLVNPLRDSYQAACLYYENIKSILPMSRCMCEEGDT